MLNIEHNGIISKTITKNGLTIDYIKRENLIPNIEFTTMMNQEGEYLVNYMNGKLFWFDGVLMIDNEEFISLYGIYKGGKKYICSLIPIDIEEDINFILSVELIDNIESILNCIIDKIIQTSIDIYEEE